VSRSIRPYHQHRDRRPTDAGADGTQGARAMWPQIMILACVNHARHRLAHPAALAGRRKRPFPT
jgi:hypothetical protein